MKLKIDIYDIIKMRFWQFSIEDSSCIVIPNPDSFGMRDPAKRYARFFVSLRMTRLNKISKL